MLGMPDFTGFTGDWIVMDVEMLRFLFMFEMTENFVCFVSELFTL